MAKIHEYGGINGTDNIDDIPEATIVENVVKKTQTISKPKAVLLAVLLWWVTWQITTLAIIATGIFEQSYYRSLPSFVGFYIIPSIPFLAIMLWRLIKTNSKKEAGD